MISIAEMRHSEEFVRPYPLLAGDGEYEPSFTTRQISIQGDVPFRYTAGTEYDRQL